MNRTRSRRSVRPWYIGLLTAAAIAVIVFAVTQIGTKTSSARTSTETVAAADGVVQSTVSGSGNVEPGVDDDVNFQTTGTLTAVDVKVGQRVTKGELLATLDPSSANLTLEEDETTLKSAQDALTSEREATFDASTDSSSNSGSSTTSGTDASTTGSSTGGSSTSSGSSTSGDSTAATASAAAAGGSGTTTTGAANQTGTTNQTGATNQAGATTTTRTTTQTATKETAAEKRAQAKQAAAEKAAAKREAAKKAAAEKKEKAKEAAAAKAEKAAEAKTVAKEETQFDENRSTEISQDEEQVQKDEDTVTSDKNAITETKLYAPASGMIASLASDSVGDTVSSGGSDSSSSSNSDATGSSSTGGTSSTSSAFAEIVNDNTMTMTVTLSEDDISSVKVGQIATVSITALSGVELAGKLTEISPLGTETDDVVSYDATITVNQSNSKVLPGMSATAEIVTASAQGVTLPTDAVTGSGSNATVDLVTDGKAVSTPVTVGLEGTSRDVITSGLKSGDDVQVTIALPSLSTSSTTSTTSATSATGGFGGSGFGGGAGFGGGGGFSRRSGA